MIFNVPMQDTGVYENLTEELNVWRMLHFTQMCMFSGLDLVKYLVPAQFVLEKCASTYSSMQMFEHPWSNYMFVDFLSGNKLA